MKCIVKVMQLHKNASSSVIIVFVKQSFSDSYSEPSAGGFP